MSEGRLACLVCRQRKVACDRQRPRCGLCLRNDWECEYKSRTHRPGLRAGYVSRLEDHLNNVEARLRRLEAELLTDSHAARRRRHVTPSSPSPGNMGDAPPYYVETRLQDANLSTGETPQFLATTPAPYAEGVIPQPEADRLINTWYREYHAWFPVVHRSSLEDDIAGSRHELVRKAILAVTILHDPDTLHQNRQVAERLRDETHNRSMDTATLQSVQALLILTICYFSQGNLIRMWNTLAICKKTAMLLNLPMCQYTPSASASRTIEQEEGTRAYWMIELLDSISTLGLRNSLSTFQIPPTMHLPCSESSWASASPANIGNPPPPLAPHSGTTQNQQPQQQQQQQQQQIQVSSGFSLCILMAMGQLGPIHQFLHLPSSHYDLRDLSQRLQWQSEAQKLDDGLTIWREEFVAAVFQLLNAEPREAIPMGEMDAFVTLTNCVLNTAIIVLLQRTAPFPQLTERESEPWPFATSRCVYACENMSAKVRRIGTDEISLQSPHLILPVFTAARFYISYSKALYADVPTNLRSLAYYLHASGRRWPLAARYEALIRAAVAEHRTPLRDCALPAEFYDLRLCPSEIGDLLWRAAEGLLLPLRGGGGNGGSELMGAEEG